VFEKIVNIEDHAIAATSSIVRRLSLVMWNNSANAGLQTCFGYFGPGHFVVASGRRRGSVVVIALRGSFQPDNIRRIARTSGVSGRAPSLARIHRGFSKTHQYN
jgi:hypothetical protein